MVLARELHQKIQDMQIKIEGSKRIAHLENEITTLTDAVHLLVSKLEKPIEEENIPDPYKDENGKTKKIDREAIPEDDEYEPEEEEYEEQEQEEVEDDDTEQDIEEEVEDDPEPNYDDDEEETEEQIDARQECQLDQIQLADQQPEHIEQFIGYNEDKEKLIKANNTKKYDDYAYTWYEDIDRDLKTKLIKRVIVLATVNYSLQEKIFYLEVKARDYEKYKSLSGILEQLLITHKSLLDKKYPTQRKLYNYSVGNTLYQFKVRRTEFIHNLVQHFLKLSKLKEKRFN